MSASLKRRNGLVMNTFADMNYHTARTSGMEAERALRRAGNARQAFADDTHKELVDTLVENGVLKAQLQQKEEELLDLRDLVSFWANGNEAYRRTVDHLREHWAPLDPTETPLKDNARPLALAKLKEAEQDPTWVAERERRNQERVAKRKQRRAAT